jgi:hypothetical protein
MRAIRHSTRFAAEELPALGFGGYRIDELSRFA